MVHSLKKLNLSILLLFLILLCLFPARVKAGRPYRVIFEKVIEYGEYQRKHLPDSLAMNNYSRLFIDVKRRNFTLLGMPTMFYLMWDGRRKALAESYEHVVYFPDGKKKVVRNIWLSTVYHQHPVLVNLLDYMRPSLYDTQLFPTGVLSPIHKSNRKYYHYQIKEINDSLTKISFKSKRINTELIRRGFIIAVTNTGRIKNYMLEGECDMNLFTLSGVMGDSGVKSIFPKTCGISSSIKFMGNHLRANMVSFYDMPITLPDTLVNSHDPKLIEGLRPFSLRAVEQQALEEFYPAAKKQAIGIDSIKSDSIGNDSIKTSTPKKKRNWVKTILWDAIGETLLKHIKAQTADDRGSMKIAPLLNPLYFGYSHSKGIYYKVDVRGSYNFHGNSSIGGRLKLGYSFKNHQLFYRLPITYTFNKERNGYVNIEFRNGNRITNSQILDKIKKNVRQDTVRWEKMGLDYFKDLQLDVSTGYDVVYNKLSLQVGVSLHRRSAVDKSGFILSGEPSTYTSFAPYIGLSWYPFSRNVPFVFTAEYEQGIKGLGSKMEYNRIEADLQYIKYLTSMRSWSVRLGAGGYLNKNKKTYFLDYKNFREDYAPNGWNDDWTGEFKLLSSNWYNASNIYLRANVTYESPMMLLSWLPWIGRIVEKERIYISGLGVKQLWPYAEMGYGFTNRVFSTAVFIGVSPHHFEGIGVKFGFELFNNW